MLEKSDSPQSVYHPMQLSQYKVNHLISQYQYHNKRRIYRGQNVCSHFLPPSELPVQIVRPLRVKIAMYRHRGLLECQLSRSNAQVRWYKNRQEILPSSKYQLISQDVYRQLTIDNVCSSDEDTYTCDAGDDKTSCQLLVEGEIQMLWLTVYFAFMKLQFYKTSPNVLRVCAVFDSNAKILEMCQ